MLPALGIEPLIGRNFSANEDRPGGEHVALISHAIWQQRFNRDPSVLGQALTLDGAPYTIIGVLPEAASAFPLNPFQIWVPRPVEVPFIAPSQLDNGGYFFQAIARLQPGVSLTQAREAMNVIAAGYRASNPANVDAPSQIEIVPLLDDAVGDQRQSYLLLFGAVGCVLLIACANIANLLLARFAGRRREIAARFALGASRADVVRQLVTESMLVAVLGGLTGLLLAQWALQALVAFGAELIPRVLEIGIDPLALGFALLVTLVTGLAIGLLPAWQAAGVNVQEALKESGRGSIGTGQRLRASLLVAEVSLSLVLLIAAGLLLTSFARLQRVSAGLRARRCLHRAARAAAGPLQPREARHLLRAVVSTPGGDARHDVGRADRPRAADRRAIAGAGGGRGPSRAADERTAAGEPPPRVAALLQHARHPDPRRARLRRARQRPRAARGDRQRDLRPATLSRRGPCWPHPGHGHGTAGLADRRGGGGHPQHHPEHAARGGLLPAGPAAAGDFTTILVRTNTSAAAMTLVVREVLRTVDPELPLLQPQMLATRIAQTVANRKLALVLLAGFAVLALVLASLGVYSVMAHLVAFRTSEIGLRMALGASPASVMRMVLGHGRRLTLLGIALGIVGALGVSRLMQQVLFEVDPADPLIYVALSVILLLVAECASWFPARRATRIDPVIALRTE